MTPRYSPEYRWLRLAEISLPSTSSDALREKTPELLVEAILQSGLQPDNLLHVRCAVTDWVGRLVRRVPAEARQHIRLVLYIPAGQLLRLDASNGAASKDRSQAETASEAPVSRPSAGWGFFMLDRCGLPDPGSSGCGIFQLEIYLYREGEKT